MRFIIKPFISVGDLEFGSGRELVNTSLRLDFKAVFEKTLDGIEFVSDHYRNEGLILGYFTEDLKLAYVILSDPCEAIFEGEDLMSMNYWECLDFMKKFDENIEEEEYIGFTSYKYGISIYAENATEDPKCDIEAVTVGGKGYFKKHV
jgi:hypothetical protein